MHLRRPVRPAAAHRIAARARRALVRRPFLWWALVGAVTIGVVASVHQRLEAVDRARDEWGSTVSVAVADVDIEAGDALRVHMVDVPQAVVPSDAVREWPSASGEMARREVGAGEIVTTADLTGDGALALAPDSWRVVAIVESPHSGAEAGDRVDVVTDGMVLQAAALVVGDHDGATLVAVPADTAPLVPLADANAGVTLIRVP